MWRLNLFQKYSRHMCRRLPARAGGKSMSKTWWRHQMETFSALLALCAGGIHRSPVNSPHDGQWRGALSFSLICAWINGWVNNGEAGAWDAIAPIMTSLLWHYFLTWLLRRYQYCTIFDGFIANVDNWKYHPQHKEFHWNITFSAEVHQTSKCFRTAI